MNLSRKEQVLDFFREAVVMGWECVLPSVKELGEGQFLMLRKGDEVFPLPWVGLKVGQKEGGEGSI